MFALFAPIDDIYYGAALEKEEEVWGGGGGGGVLALGRTNVISRSSFCSRSKITLFYINIKVWF
jgi:hypothetical protein